MQKNLGAIVVSLLAAAVLAAPAQALDDRRDLGTFGDWDAQVITKSGGVKECFMVSKAKKWSANRKNVSRGDIYITVTNRPKLGIKDQVNVNVGYPLAEGGTVRLAIDGRSRFEFFNAGNSAWAYSDSDDRASVAAMKAGSSLVVTGQSARGTVTTDTYSLRGFTAANRAIDNACR